MSESRGAADSRPDSAAPGGFPALVALLLLMGLAAAIALGTVHHPVVGAWSGLPIEQPFLWVLASITAVIVFETVKLLLHGRAARRGIREMLFQQGSG